ncbi:tail fiber domain-containing protein [Vibrio fluvialis]|nr:tail fiber domain-containing protein [Vibrio fluvialis]EKO3527559.1 tail fiber domain-containing protein [Vibrio fluvialis]ELP3312364.1 tail fiber domain-containing protein [Vibrio fluvialis]
MGLFGGGGLLGKITDPGDFLGSQSTASAAEASNKLGQQTLAMQQDWLNYIKGQYEPYSEAGQRALAAQEGMLSQLAAGPDYAAAANSPAFQEANRQAQYSLLNSAEATGGLGSTATGNALGASSANVLSNVANEQYGNLYNYFNALGALSGQGIQGSSGLGSFGGDTISGMAGTLSGIGNGALNAAAQQTQRGTGLLSAGIGLLSAFSDIRLKKNVKATGEYTKLGNEIYTWDWNEKAERLGLVGSGRGVIADHAEQVTPAAVSTDKSGYKVVDYARV